MRILMLAQFYPPIIGGEETYTRNLSIALAQRGHDVVVATLWSPGLPDVTVDNGVRVYRVKGSLQHLPGLYSDEARRHAPPIPDPLLTLALRQVIEREHPDIVHAHNWIVRSFLPLKAWSGAKLIMSLHDYSLICAKKNLIYHDTLCDGPAFTKCVSCAVDFYGVLKGLPTSVGNWIMGASERHTVDMFVPVSQAVVIFDRLVESKVPYQVISNFVPDDLAALTSSDDPRLEQLPKGDFLLFVGDLRPVKGLDVLLAAYRKLSSPPPLVLIGRPLPDMPKDLPPNVHILNTWPHELVMHAWKRCAIALAPSTGRETFGYVVLEAMTMGKPVVASRIGGIPDLVADGETGYLVPPGDENALCNALHKLINDPALREQMGTAGKKRAELFKASSIVPQIEAMYEKVSRPSTLQQTAIQADR